jgi:hypothetical protein
MTSDLSLLVSQTPLPGWIYVLLPAVVLVVLLARRMREKKRTGELTKLAGEVGLRLASSLLPQAEESLKALPLFSARQRRFSNAMVGYAAGGEVLLFDFAFPAGKYLQTQTVAAFYWKGACMPKFQLRPERLMDQVMQKLGYQDIDSETFPEFSRRYLLRGSDEAAVSAFFGPDKLGFMESRLREEKLSVEAAGEWLAVFSPGVTVPPEGLRDFLENAGAIASALGGAVSRSAFGSNG